MNERIEAIKRDLAELIPDGEAIVFSREGYSLKQIAELEGYKRAMEQSPLARGKCQHYHGGGDRCECGARPNVVGFDQAEDSVVRDRLLRQAADALHDCVWVIEENPSKEAGLPDPAELVLSQAKRVEREICERGKSD